MYIFDLDINVTDKATGGRFRYLSMEISFTYKLNEDDLNLISNTVTGESSADEEFYKECLYKINEIVQNITPYGNKGSLNISTILEEKK